MELTSNGNYWDSYTLEDARGFLWGESVGPAHPSRLAAQKGLQKLMAATKGTKSILEVPCAAGAEYEALQALGDLTCMDRTPVMLNALKKRYPEAKTIQGDIREIPVKDGAFDWVYARAIFEHLPSMTDVKLAMGECLRVSREGCVFSFFLPPGDHEEIDWNSQFFNNRYRISDVLHALSELGAKVLSVENVSVEGTPYLDDGLIIYVKKV